MIKKKYLVIVAAALLMISAVAVKPAMAFLTDTHNTAGTSIVHLSDKKIEIIPKERIEKDIKVISVENTGDLPVYARVKVIVGRTQGLIFDKDSSKGWSEKDGYYYYDSIIEPGKTSNELYVKIDPKNTADEEFNVIVVAEAARVKNDGSAGWDEKIAKETSITTPTQNEGGATNED